jgi:glutaminase A-like protein
MSVMSDVVGQSAAYSVEHSFSRVSIVPSSVTGLIQTVADAYYAQWRSHALGLDNHLLVQYDDESSWSLGESMFADMWLQTGLISQDVRIRSLIA